LAALSWSFIEQPFRRKTTPIERLALFRGAAAAMSIAVAVAGASIWTQGFPQRYTPEIASILQNATAFRDDKQLKSCRRRAPADVCVFGAPVPATYAVWGDSHALVMLRAIGDMAARHGAAVKSYINPGCPPIAGLDSADKTCATFADAVLTSLVSSPDVRTVILISNYKSHLRDRSGSEQGSTSTSAGPIATSAAHGLELEALASPFAHQLDVTVNRLLAAGKVVVLVYPLPDLDFRAPWVIGRLLTSGKDPASKSVSFADSQESQKDVFAVLDRLGVSGRVLRVYPHQRLCDEERCLVYANKAILYRDDNHLSSAGAAFVMPALAPVFDEETMQTSATGERKR